MRISSDLNGGHKSGGETPLKLREEMFPSIAIHYQIIFAIGMEARCRNSHMVGEIWPCKHARLAKSLVFGFPSHT